MSTDTFETPRLPDTGSWHRAEYEQETATTEQQPLAAARSSRVPDPAALAGHASDIVAAVGLRLSGIVPAASRGWRWVSQRCAVAWAAAGARTDGLRRSAEASRWCSLDVAIVLVWSIAVAMVAIALALAVSPLLGIAVALAEGVALGLGGGRLARLVTR